MVKTTSQLLKKSNAIDLVINHLNVSNGSNLTYDELYDSLQRGFINDALSDQSKALISRMFLEIEPHLIVRCIIESKSSFAKVNNLYLSTLKEFPRSIDWENNIQHFL